MKCERYGSEVKDKGRHWNIKKAKLVIAYVGEGEDDIKYCCGECNSQLPPLGAFLEVGRSFWQKLDPARFCSQCGALIDCRDEGE